MTTLYTITPPPSCPHRIEPDMDELLKTLKQADQEEYPPELLAARRASFIADIEVANGEQS